MTVNRNESAVAIDESDDRANEGVIDIGKVRSEILCIPSLCQFRKQRRTERIKTHTGT